MQSCMGVQMVYHIGVIKSAIFSFKIKFCSSSSQDYTGTANFLTRTEFPRLSQSRISQTLKIQKASSGLCTSEFPTSLTLWPLSPIEDPAFILIYPGPFLSFEARCIPFYIRILCGPKIVFPHSFASPSWRDVQAASNTSASQIISSPFLGTLC